MSEEKIITDVCIFKNGMVMVFDQDGKQMPEYQGKREEVLSKIKQVYKGEIIGENNPIEWSRPEYLRGAELIDPEKMAQIVERNRESIIKEDRPRPFGVGTSGKVGDKFKVISQRATPFDGVYTLTLENEKGDKFYRMTRNGPFDKRLHDYMLTHNLENAVGIIVQLREHNGIRFFDIIDRV